MLLFEDDFAKNFGIIKSTLQFNELCGKNKTGHFDGVLTIINKIFLIIRPKAFFGLKDYQQFILVKNLQRLFPDIKIIGLPIIREGWACYVFS